MVNNSRYRVLNRKGQFAQLKERGRKVRIHQWLILNFQANDVGHMRCGWTITKGVGNAVIRNKLKRWCREFFATFDGRKHAVDVNVVVLPSRIPGFFKSMEHMVLQDSLNKGWAKIETSF